MLDENRQLITTDYVALKQWCMEQPAPTQRALKVFIRHLGQEQMVRNLKGRKATFCYARTSYGLKHVVERLSDALGEHEYVSNEQFIIAMVQAGFDLKNACEEYSSRDAYQVSPNYYFKLPKFKETNEWKSAIVKGVVDGQY